MRKKKKVLLIALVIIFILIVLFIFGVFKEYRDSWSKEARDKLPIVYSDNYDITLFGVQKLHPFDSEKYSKIAKYLIKELGIPKEKFYAPQKVSEEDLRLVHTSAYLDSQKNSTVLARIAELGFLRVIPNFILQERLLDSVRYATGGTILGAELALEKGWAINLAGGYHHTKADSSGGFGFYADVPIAVYKLWQNNPNLKILIVDLDAHQGNGNESIFADDERVYILDMYHEFNYPMDEEVKKYIDMDLAVEAMDDQSYLTMLNKYLPQAVLEAEPDLIIYNAGTDVYQGDPLGRMNLSKAGIIKRDELVFETAKDNKLPILMVLSGGYTAESSAIVGESIINLIPSGDKFRF